MSAPASVRRTRSQKNADTRAALLNAAVEVASEHGYADTSIARVAEKAGVALGSVYTHFENRRALLLEALQNASGQVLDEVQAKVALTPPEVDREQARFIAFLEIRRARPGFSRLMSELQVFEPEVWRQFILQLFASSPDRMRENFSAVADRSDEDLVFLNVVINAVAGALADVLQAYEFDEDKCRQTARIFSRLVHDGILRSEEAQT